MQDKELFHKYTEIFSSHSLPTCESKRREKEINLEEVIHLTEKLEEFISSSSFHASQIITYLTELIVGFGLTDQFKGEDQDYGPEDFPHKAENAEKCFELLKVLLREIHGLESSHKQQLIINVLLLCATHHKSFHWSSESTVKMGKELLTELLECTQHQGLSSLLCDETFYPTMFKGILKKMRPALMKDTWMLNPSSCRIFSWLLTHVKHPYLVDYLPDVLPPAFMFAAYFAIPQRVIGIQCFDHILDNVPPTLVKLDGKQEAIYHSLSPLAYSKEIDIITILHPCLLKLPMMSPQKLQIVYWDKFDELFHQLLVSAEFECNPQVKGIFLEHILTFTEVTPPFKHLKRILEVVKRTTSDTICPLASSQITALHILKSVIVSCWPRMSNHCFSIIVLIVELLEVNDTEKADKVRLLCQECVCLLNLACKEKFESLALPYIESCPHLPGAEFLKDIMHKEQGSLAKNHVNV